MRAKENANKLRKLQTPEEKILWDWLKDRRLGLYKFRRQVPIGPIIVDFCCFEKKLVIELDGYHHKLSKLNDITRDNYLATQGFTVLHFWNGEVNKDIQKVLTKIVSALESPSSGRPNKNPKDRPPSPVKGEGKNEV